MRPFPYRQSKVDPRKENYNKRLCTARRVVENAFGILVQKWRIFFRPIATKVETTILIVKTTCILHNFLRIRQNENETSDFSDPSDKPSQQCVLRRMATDPKRATNLAFSIREKFVNLFN